MSFHPQFTWSNLVSPLAAAEDAVARLDQRLAQSPIAAGWRERSHFSDAVAALWLEGSLVLTEDLVLHDDSRDLRTPTHDLARAHLILRCRRRILAHPIGWALSDAGLAVLRHDDDHALEASPPTAPDGVDRPATDDATWDAILADIDALLERGRQTRAGLAPRPRDPFARDLLAYDDTWNEDDRLRAWQNAINSVSDLPPTLAAAFAYDAWSRLNPLQHRPWIGALLSADVLRAHKKTRHHLSSFSAGLRAVPHERRRARDDTTRLIAILDAIRAAAESGLKDHERWSLAHTNLANKLLGRRSTSRLPGLIDFVMSRPLVSTATIAAALKVTPRAAQNLVIELGLREITGRGSFRAWAVL